MPQGGGLKVTADKKSVGSILPPDRTAVIGGGQMEVGGIPSPEGTAIMHCLLFAVSPSSSAGALFSRPILSLPVSLCPPAGSCSSLLPAHAPVPPDSTRRSQDELLSLTHAPLCRGTVWGPGHLFPRPDRELAGEASSPAEVYHYAPILSGAPLNPPPGGIPIK